MPLHDSKAVVEHATKKAEEVRAKKLPYIDVDFQIIIQDRETFDADTWHYRMLLRKRLRPVVPEPTDEEIAVVSDSDQTLADNLRRNVWSAPLLQGL